MLSQVPIRACFQNCYRLTFWLQLFNVPLSVTSTFNYMCYRFHRVQVVCDSAAEKRYTVRTFFGMIHLTVRCEPRNRSDADAETSMPIPLPPDLIIREAKLKFIPGMLQKVFI